MGDKGDSGVQGKPVYVAKFPHNGLPGDSGVCRKGFWYEHIEKLEGSEVGRFRRLEDSRDWVAREIGRCGKFGRIGIWGAREKKAKKKGGEGKERRETIKNKDKEKRK